MAAMVVGSMGRALESGIGAGVYRHGPAMRMKRPETSTRARIVAEQRGVPDWVHNVKRDPAARGIAASWRRLAGNAEAGRAGSGEATLVACSGGADSSALVLALAAATTGSRNRPRLVVAHVVHDLRPRREALADRDAVKRLAAMAGLEFVETRVRVRARGGNLEAGARRERYTALAKLAKKEGLRFIATAHHADDQLETVLMALMRGAGPRGLSGVRESRPLEAKAELRGQVRLIRPMLGADAGRADSERICRGAGWAWAEDATNTDVSRLRSAVRHRVVPVLKELRPGVSERACATARVMADADRLLRSRAAKMWAKAKDVEATRAVWKREVLRESATAVVGELIRLAAGKLSTKGADRMNSRVMAAAVRAICDGSTEPRRLNVGPLQVEVTARAVTIAVRRSR
jgi:tRNA(Ile)-lysidine synthase